MRNFLFLLSIGTIVASSTTSIVSCGTKPKSNQSTVDQELLNSLKNDINKKFDEHFIKNNVPFIETSKNSIKYNFFKKSNLEKLYSNPNDGEVTLNINSLSDIDYFKNDMQNFANLQDLASSIDSFKNNTENNYSVFLSEVSNVYVGYDFGEEITIKKQTDNNNNVTYSGSFNVKFKWQYYTQAVNIENYDYKGTFTISDDEELIANIIGLTEVGKKFYSDLESPLHFSNVDLNITENESWKDVSETITSFFKVEKNINSLLQKMKEYTDNEQFEITYDTNSFFEDLKVSNNFSHTNNKFLYNTDLQVFNDLVFKTKSTDELWNQFFNLETNVESYKNFESSVNNFTNLWVDESASIQEITNYLTGAYSFGQFKLNNLNLSYAGGNQINLGQIIMPFTYKSNITTISSNNVLGTSVKAKAYLKNLLSDFHQKTKIIENTKSNVRNNPLAATSTTKNSPLWSDLDLDFNGKSYKSFFWKDYNESLKKIVINGENNILKIEGNSNSYVYNWTEGLLISDGTTTKDLTVNLGYFKYRFGHKGAIFYAESDQ
ncbi:hypothetical protein [Spiroplasma taiwanense]|uniref:Lipoprotein n=1 Tax=Spiroplasma taiwanense CT-1 TaxID=1276220 RepID=S5M047_9MOLU|nr:hypothetical protein [Spiroplasma taiwanense]AGR41377.1 hypothetical protein STAIW_v1c07810 [Spiroplasma taiwanense CT-1]